jgi:alkylation response protein AidB-like acyl-CoA dehydrogenase
MEFDLTGEQKAMRDVVHDVLATRLPLPTLSRSLEVESLDRGLWRDLSHLGLGGVLVSPDRGGLGLDLLTLAVAAEALGRHVAPAPLVAGALAAWLVDRAGTDAQRARWLGPLMEGDAVAAFALAEDGQWLPQAWTLAADNLTGSKRYVERAAEADLLVVGCAGGGLALIEPTAPGVEILPLDGLDRSRPMFDVRFEGALARPLDAGPELTERLVDAWLVLLAADACGAAAGVLALAVDYAKARRQFDRPIGSFQAVKHQLADIAFDVEPCRPLFWYAAHAWDVLPDARRRAAAIAKAHVTDVAVKSARAAIEVHGGVGYTWDYPAHLFLKRAMADRALMGQPSLHRQRSADLAGW